jgi:hypothetical protein
MYKHKNIFCLLGFFCSLSNTVPSSLTLRTISLTQKRLLVVNVETLDKSTSFNDSTLTNAIFGNNLITSLFREQIQKCSKNKLDFIQAQGKNVRNGILNLKLNISTINVTYMDIKNEAIRILKGKPNFTDYVIFCIPPGTQPPWMAFAQQPGWYSVYNDRWCLSLSGKMHEMGHNFGLGHANTITTKYGDASGYMGASTISAVMPKMCFNAYHSWLLGWYNEFHKILEFKNNEIYRIDLTPITDNLKQTNIVIIKIQEKKSFVSYYLMYNSKQKFNNETITSADKVQIISAEGNTNISTLIGELGENQNFKLLSNTTTGKYCVITTTTKKNYKMEAEIQFFEPKYLAGDVNSA